MKNYRIFALTAAIGLLLDQLSKIYIGGTFELHQTLTVVKGFFNITYVRNPGAAFGILADNAIRLPFFVGVSLLAGIGILWYLRKVDRKDSWQHFALGLLFSGAIGNLIDRIRLGEVIDFLDVHWYQYHWPAFNIADSAICVGVAILLLCSWREERQKKQTKNA
ncbi:MAG: signal peptidase II [Chloroflexi bacterium]|nr:signal peptidase II [Chloroflexota bacterium]